MGRASHKRGICPKCRAARAVNWGDGGMRLHNWQGSRCPGVGQPPLPLPRRQRRRAS